MATNLASGVTRRLTSNPGYTGEKSERKRGKGIIKINTFVLDPVDMSPDNEWIVVMDTRESNRITFAAGMRGIPPLTDLATTSTVASIRNNGQRRFFQPILIDKYGDRGDYQGQLLTAEGDGSAGSINDPNWNGMADPRWSPNGTSVVFWQALVTSPACGGVNPLICPNSTEPGLRRFRILIAQFPDRKVAPPLAVSSPPSSIPWGTPYIPGASPPSHSPIPNGNYILKGKKSGFAEVTLNFTSAATSVSANYTNYSDDGYHIIDGFESASFSPSSPILLSLSWRSSLTLSGCISGKKVTSPEGYFVVLDLMNPVVQSTGNLTTTIGNVTYVSPNPGT